MVKFGIGTAVKEMWLGHKVTRENWNGPGQYLKMEMPHDSGNMTLPFIYITTVQGDTVPWLCSQTDLLAQDWMIVQP